MIGSLASVFSSNGVYLHRPSSPTHAKIPETSKESASFFSENAAIVELSQQDPAALVEDTGNAHSGRENPENESGGAPGQQLTEEEKKQVAELAERDREVRQHEQAHIAAAGGYAKGGPTYEYQKGPDGKQYAVGGEVQIDTSKESDPERTIQKAAVIRRAANAPAEPSGQDRAVAAAASQMEAEARRELAVEKQEEARGEEGNNIHQYNAEGRGQSIHELGGEFSLVA